MNYSRLYPDQLMFSDNLPFLPGFLTFALDIPAILISMEPDIYQSG